MRNSWDISRPLTKDLAPWPGDTPFRYELIWRLSQTCAVNVGALNTSTHNGTHADAPFHFQGEGAAIDSVPLENYIGPAVVIDLVEKFSRTQPSIAIADLEHARPNRENAPGLAENELLPGPNTISRLDSGPQIRGDRLVERAARCLARRRCSFS